MGVRVRFEAPLIDREADRNISIPGVPPSAASLQDGRRGWSNCAPSVGLLGLRANRAVLGRAIGIDNLGPDSGHSPISKRLTNPTHGIRSLPSRAMPAHAPFRSCAEPAQRSKRSRRKVSYAAPRLSGRPSEQGSHPIFCQHSTLQSVDDSHQCRMATSRQRFKVGTEGRMLGLSGGL